MISGMIAMAVLFNGATVTAEGCQHEAAHPNSNKIVPSTTTPNKARECDNGLEIMCPEFYYKTPADYKEECDVETDAAECKCCKPKENGGYVSDIHASECFKNANGVYECRAGNDTGQDTKVPGGKTETCPETELGACDLPCQMP
jgi:hypothetical protein